MFFYTYDYFQVLLSAVVASIWTLQRITPNTDMKLTNLEMIPTSAFSSGGFQELRASSAISQYTVLRNDIMRPDNFF